MQQQFLIPAPSGSPSGLETQHSPGLDHIVGSPTPQPTVPAVVVDTIPTATDSVAILEPVEAAVPPPTHRTRPRHGIVRPKVQTDGTVTYTAVVTDSKPTTYKEAARDPLWGAAMDSEFAALQQNKTWYPLDLV